MKTFHLINVMLKLQIKVNAANRNAAQEIAVNASPRHNDNATAYWITARDYIDFSDFEDITPADNARIETSIQTVGNTVAYHYDIFDINGKRIRHVTESTLFAFEFCDGYAAYQEYAERLAYQEASKEAMQSIIDAALIETQRLKDAGHTAYDLVCKSSQYPQLKAMNSYILGYHKG